MLLETAQRPTRAPRERFVPDVFLSYSREDQAIARRYADALAREGFTVWWDQALNPGETFDQVTSDALRSARAVVVLWSRRSVESRWVRSEATQADRHGTLMPVMIESCERPILFELTHTADLSGWDGSATDPHWRSFVDSLRRFVGRDGGRAEAFSATPGQPGAAPPTRPGQAPGPVAAPVRRSMTLPFVLITVIGALLLGAGVAWLVAHRTATSPERGAAAAGATTPEGRVSLAVLPFADLSAAGDQEYFSDGLTEEILNQLAQVRDLAVTGRTSSFSFKGRNEDLREIARKLGVDNLLEGSVRREGNQLRITAQLIDGRSGAHRWSKTYAREISDVFALQEEIAKDVAQALRITLDVGATSRAQGGTTNVEAFDRYLRARSLTLQGGREATERAVTLLREALALDPEFSRAWLALAFALDGPSGLSVFGTPEQAVPLVREAEQARDRGVRLAPDSRAAKLVLMERLVAERNWAQAVAAAREQAQSDLPSSENLLEAGSGVGVLMGVGQLSEAARLARQQQAKEPLSLGISTTLQIFLYAARQFSDAEAEYQRSLGLTGNHQRAHFRGLLMRLAEAAPPESIDAQFKRLFEEEDVPAPFLRTLAEVIHDRDEALAVLRSALEDPANADFARTMMVFQLADALGDGELALDAIRRVRGANDQVSTPLIWIAPVSDLRTLPGFKAMLREMGIAQYFRESGDWGDACRPVGDDDFECR
jgi:TolB-like protein